MEHEVQSDGAPRAHGLRALRGVLERWSAVDSILFVAFTGACIAFVGSRFVFAMLHQTGGAWSAPLDDVFIHFDYARSTARGYPFQWSEGNGYSSGNTSVTYPFVLAIGYRLGFTDLALMKWAVLVAAASVLAYFVVAARLTRPLGRWAKYLVPPCVLSLGALDWSLVSGMENAFHLAVFAATFGAALSAERAVRDGASRARLLAWATGGLGALLVLTRPESVVCVAALSVLLVVAGWKLGKRAALFVGARVAIPGALAVIGQMLANRALTGEWAQAGAVSKLALANPYIGPSDVVEDWRSNLAWASLRLAHHHFADHVPYGYIPIVLALVPLFDRRLRRHAICLWAMIVGWMLIVSLNGQVRWQNERYLMAAVAWLFTLSALGIGVLFSRFGESTAWRFLWGMRAAVAGIAILLYAHHQIPNLRDQEWFYARASRNIHDQQYTAGRGLRELDPAPRRILVGDAGAITYAADLPGLDIIGLGGYKNLPFARANRHGLGATLELIERMPPDDRPDVMAIYPSWWGNLPVLFGHYVEEYPVVGNVICGGASKVIYRASWGALDATGLPRTLRRGEHVTSEIDVADLVSEREREYQFPHPGMGWVIFHVLNDPNDARLDLFDAGRIIPNGKSESAELVFPSEGRLAVRTAATQNARVRVDVAGVEVGVLDIRPTDTWDEPSIELPPGLPKRARVTLTPIEGEWADYHVWVIATGGVRAVAGR